MLGQVDQWLRSSWSSFGVGAITPGTPLRLALLPNGGGEGWRWIGLVWRGHDEEPCLVVKFTRYPRDNSRAATEPLALRALEQWSTTVPRLVPRSLGQATVANRAVTVESVAPGRPLLNHLRENRRRPAAQLVSVPDLLDWLAALDNSSARPCTADEARDWILAPLGERAPGFGLTPAQIEVLDRLSKDAERLQRRSPLHAVYSHGDVGPPNVLVSRQGQLTGLVDWEKGGWGLPITDLIYFLARLGEELVGVDITSAITGSSISDHRPLPASYVESARQSLQSMCRRTGVDREWLPVLAAITWLHHAGNEHARDPAAETGAASRRRLRRYLDELFTGKPER